MIPSRCTTSSMLSTRMSSRGRTPKRGPMCGRCASGGQKPDRPGANVLPDLHALTRFEPQLVPGLRRKHLVELVDVLDDLVAAELLGGVRVDREQPDRFLVAGLHPPDARVGLEDEP